MTDPVRVFFYGGLINPEVMTRVGLPQREQIVAAVPGFQIRIEPWVTLQPCPLSTCYGVVMPVSHQELEAVYAKLAVPYFPYPVIAQTADTAIAALTYLAGPMERRVADEAHIAPLLSAAEGLNFPGWYLNEIRSFLPAL